MRGFGFAKGIKMSIKFKKCSRLHIGAMYIHITEIIHESASNVVLTNFAFLANTSFYYKLEEEYCFLKKAFLTWSC